MNNISIHTIVKIKIQSYKKCINRLGSYYCLTLVITNDKKERTELIFFSKSEFEENGEEEPFDLQFEFPEVEIDDTPLKL